MREGPLADLFRSTSDDAPADPPEAPALRPRGSGRGEEGRRGAAAAEPPSRRRGAARRAEAAGARAEPEAPFDQEPRRRAAPRPPPERLKRVFSEEPKPRRREESSPSNPRYGREEPAYEPPGSGEPHQPVIKVVGVGGAGVNAVNRMVEARIPGVEFMAVNTDLQSLQLCVADVTVHIGDEQTRGLGAGADPEVGHRSAFEEQDKIKRLLKGSDMVFVAAGAGGGTGTRRRPGGRPPRPRGRRAHGRHRHQAVQLRGQPPRQPGRQGHRGAGRRGRHPDRRPQRPPARGARPADLDGRGLPGRRRRPAPGRAGDLRPGHAARP